MKVLVFSSYPDDEIIGCGGTIAKHVKHGNEVKIVYMTTGNRDWRGESTSDIASQREEESRRTCGILGIPKTNLIFFRKPNGNLQHTTDGCIEVAKLIRKEKPDIVFVPNKGETHPNHIETYKLVENAIIKARDSRYKAKGFEIWKPKVVLCYEVWTMLDENDVKLVTDITSYLHKKIEAIEAHTSQNSHRFRNEHLILHIKNMGFYRNRLGWEGAPPCECFDTIALK